MIRFLLAVALLMCVSLSAAGASGWIIADLTKRENIKDVEITYTDSETASFFKYDVEWGSKWWPSEKNPFNNNDTMSLKTFLDTFELLIPVGGYDGGSCKELDYSIYGGLINNTAYKCTIKYEKYGKTWSLTMMAISFSMGNAVEGASISSDFLAGISVK